jgi:hypothetical protein
MMPKAYRIGDGYGLALVRLFGLTEPARGSAPP